MKKEDMVCEKCLCYGGPMETYRGDPRFMCRVEPHGYNIGEDPSTYWCARGQWTYTYSEHGGKAWVRWGGWEDDNASTD